MVKDLNEGRNSENHQEPPKGEGDLTKKEPILNKLTNKDDLPQFMTFSKVIALLEKERVLAGSRRFLRRPPYLTKLLTNHILTSMNFQLSVSMISVKEIPSSTSASS